MRRALLRVQPILLEQALKLPRGLRVVASAMPEDYGLRSRGDAAIVLEVEGDVLPAECENPAAVPLEVVALITEVAPRWDFRAAMENGS